MPQHTPDAPATERNYPAPRCPLGGNLINRFAIENRLAAAAGLAMYADEIALIAAFAPIGRELDPRRETQTGHHGVNRGIAGTALEGGDQLVSALADDGIVNHLDQLGPDALSTMFRGDYDGLYGAQGALGIGFFQVFRDHLQAVLEKIPKPARRE